MGLPSVIRSLKQRPRKTVSSTRALWNSGFATSTLGGGDLATAGVANQWMWLCEGFVIIGGLTPVADITLRLYRTIAGAERLWFTDIWTVAAGPDAIFWWWWPIEIFGTIRVEVYSDNPLDDNAAIPWEYSRKDW